MGEGSFGRMEAALALDLRSEIYLRTLTTRTVRSDSPTLASLLSREYIMERDGLYVMTETGREYYESILDHVPTLG